MSEETETKYAVEVKNTNRKSGRTEGWEIHCDRHDTMDKAIICKERAIKNNREIFNAAPPHIQEIVRGTSTEMRIVKVVTVREVLEEAEEVSLVEDR